jgi:hypothetical protein
MITPISGSDSAIRMPHKRSGNYSGFAGGRDLEFWPFEGFANHCGTNRAAEAFARGSIAAKPFRG